MVEEFRYEDKRVGIDENDKGSLKNLVNEEFKKMDRYGYRDDQEIRNAGWNIVNKLITEIKNDKAKVYGPRALDPLIQLSKKLKEEYYNMKGMKLLTNNKDKINQVAQRIDNAENETLKRLAKNRTTQDSRDLVKKSNEVYKKNPMFVMEGGNDSSKQTGNIIFTKESNPVKIHEALNGLFKDPNIVYEIDYSGCTNQRIKEKMVGLIGTETCYLKYDKGQNTYTIRDSQGNGISHRAYIWEGVKLIPAGVRQRQAYSEQKTQNENLGKVDNSQIDSLIGGMLKDMPSARRLTEEEQKDLVKKTEDRITELLRRAKKLGYELETECVTKKWLGKGHVELHLNSGSSEVDWTVWGNGGSYNEILGEKLDNFIDSNEGEYVSYLTKRVMSKWQELDSITKIETTNVEVGGGQNLTKEEREQAQLHKEQVLYGIGLLEKMVENYRESEGDSWLDNDDKKLVAIKKLINNAKASIENSRNIDDNIITEKFIEPIREEWMKIKGITRFDINTTNYGQNQVYENSTYRKQHQQLRNLFFGDRDQQISAVRSLGGYNRIFDKTETSFLREEIELNEGLTVKNENIKECINNINTNFSMSVFDEDGNINEETKEQYDKLFVAASGGIGSLISLLVDNKMLPITWRKEEDYVIKGVEKLKNQLKAINEQVNNFPYTPQSMAEHQHAEKLRLQQKENKTEDDIRRLQALTYLENNPKEQEKINGETIDQMKIELKYGNLGNITKGCLFHALAELGGGADGKNADIYNDIIGYGAFDFSDENAKIVGEIITDIVITVVVAVMTGGIGGMVMAASLRGLAVTARLAKWTQMANRILKVVDISKKGYKGLSWGARAVKLGVEAPGLLFEGTIFNNASKTIHAALKGTSLDSLNFNPLTRENVETAAFLFMLGIGNQIAGKGFSVFDKTGKYAKTKLHLNSSKVLESLGKTVNGVGAEMAGMLLATEGINLTFGHEVVDPVTGEVKNVRGLSWPSNEEWATMIGMIIAFRVVKPTMWKNLTDKLNDGTLEICRTENRKNPVIRNTKTGELVLLKDLHNRTDILNDRGGVELGNESQWDNVDSEEYSKKQQERKQQRERECSGFTEERELKRLQRQLSQKFHPDHNQLRATKETEDIYKKMKNQFDERNLAGLRELYDKQDFIYDKAIEKGKKKTENEGNVVQENEKQNQNKGEREEQERKQREEQERKQREEQERKQREEQERKQREEQERKQREEQERKQREEQERKQREEQERREKEREEQERKQREEQERREKEREEQERKQREEQKRREKEREKKNQSKLVDRDQFADNISKNRYKQGGYPKGEIEMRKGKKFSVDAFFKRHPNMKEKYKKALEIGDEHLRAEELSKIDVEVAEQWILESGRYIEFGVEKLEKAEASYKALSEVYDGKIEKIVREDGSVVLRLKKEVVSNGGETIPGKKKQEAVEEKHENVENSSVIESIESGNISVTVGEHLPTTVTLGGGQVVPIETVMPPTVQRKLVTALAVVEKSGGLPAVIAKNPEIATILPSKSIVSPYWMVPLLLLPGLHWDEGDGHPIIMQFPDDFLNVIDNLEENPKITGVELPTDITGPFDLRGNANVIKSEIDAKFEDLIIENHIEAPLRDNALILLRGVSSRTYNGKGNGEQYNKDLSLTRAEEFKKYLMQKFPELTEDNFVLDSYYQPSSIDNAQRFQGVSMGVVDMQKYGGITSMRQLIPSGQNGRVL